MYMDKFPRSWRQAYDATCQRFELTLLEKDNCKFILQHPTLALYKISTAYNLVLNSVSANQYLETHEDMYNFLLLFFLIKVRWSKVIYQEFAENDCKRNHEYHRQF